MHAPRAVVFLARTSTHTLSNSAVRKSLMRTSTVWLGPILLLLAGCAAISPVEAPSDPNAPMIGPGQRLNLPRPADLGRTVVATQLITARTFVMEVNISVTPERAVIVGLDPVGRRALTITWKEQNISAEVAPWVPASVRPGSLLADIILIYWPEAVVRKALPAGGELIQEAHGRTIRISGRDVLRVDHSWAVGAQWNGTLQYSNFAWSYEINVQSSETRR